MSVELKKSFRDPIPFPAPYRTDKSRDEHATRILQQAARVISAEARAAARLLNGLGQDFVDAVDLICQCQGNLILIGVGKSGLIAQKISATMASTGTPSHFVHASEAVHGDLGRIQSHDVVIILSNSGETEEVVRLLSPIKELGCRIIAMTSNDKSSLARHADLVLTIGSIEEAGPIGLVPTTSTTAMLVLGDALSVSVFETREFSRADYARYHPGGSLGKKLMTVAEVMRPCTQSESILSNCSIEASLEMMTQAAGGLGAVSIVDEEGIVVGVFTDGDLRRHLLLPGFNLQGSISKVMTSQPSWVYGTQLVAEAAQIMKERNIDQILVVNENNRPIGWLDVHDLLVTGLLTPQS